MSKPLVLCLAFALAGIAAACGESKVPEKADAGPQTGGDGGGLRSAGCGEAPPTMLGRYTKQTETVTVADAYAATYTNREYWLRMPLRYDPERAYPLIFVGPGCGESGSTPIPMQTATGEDAIIVGLNGIDNCFNKDAADTPELAYFDATLATLEASTCVDTKRIYMTGFSSGSWLTSYLGCVRGDVLRAQGSIAGGLPPIPATCTGPIPAIYVADTADSHNSPETVMNAMARVLATNGCGTETEPYDLGVPSPCVQYKGCMPGFPVVWCLTSGAGHTDQSSSMISTVGFWHFWSSLEPTTH